MSLLLHVCCGPCSLAPLTQLTQQGRKITGFFFNPNIHPLEEYMKRRESAGKAFAAFELPLVYADLLSTEQQTALMHAAGLHTLGNGTNDQGRHTEHSLKLPQTINPLPWLHTMYGHEEKRCPLCWQSRLAASVAYAAKSGFRSFSTSLLYSRYQEHTTIKTLGEDLAQKYHLDFYYEDFRVHWRAGIDYSKALGLYRQQYCGCLFSEYERYAKQFQRNAQPG